MVQVENVYFILLRYCKMCAMCKNVMFCNTSKTVERWMNKHLTIEFSQTLHNTGMPILPTFVLAVPLGIDQVDEVYSLEI